MLMYTGFGEYLRNDKSRIDNTTFRLHYRVTVGLILLCSALNTSHQFIGDPISCMTSAPSTSMVNSYCWIHGTFTVADKLNASLGEEAIHMGVGPKSYDKDGREIYHAYYQWVCIVLFVQAALCYFPHYLWESFEGGKIQMLLQDLDREKLDTSSANEEKRKSVCNYFIRSRGTHNSYTFKFLFCEFLNFVNIVGQMFLMDKFLNGQFSTYGRDLIATTERDDFELRADPLNRIFPKMTKCDFYLYGPSGTVQTFDSLCLLPVNIINEKIYILLWFWYIFVSIFTAIHLILKTISVISGHFRLISLGNVAKTINRDDLKLILSKCNYGDWFLLKQLGKYIRPETYHCLLMDIRDRVDKKRAENLD